MSRARNLAGFGSAITNPQNPVNVRLGVATAIEYYGDGSNLTGTPGGLGTSLLPDDLNSPLNKIYYTNANLTIGSTITVDPPDSASAAYTQYTNIVLTGDADLIVADGDDFIPDILGIGTDVDTPGILASGEGKVRVDNITDKSGVKAPKFPYGLAVPVGAAVSVGYGTEATPGVIGVDTSSGIFFPSAGNVAISAGGTEAIRFNSSGNVGIGTNNPAVHLDLYGEPPRIRLVRNSTGVRHELRGNADNLSLRADTSDITNDTRIDFQIDGSEKARFTSDGELFVARTVGLGSTTHNIQVGQQILAPEGLTAGEWGWSQLPERLWTFTQAADNINNHTLTIDCNEITGGPGSNGTATFMVMFVQRRSATTGAYDQINTYVGYWSVSRQETNLANVAANNVVTTNMTVDSITAANPATNLTITFQWDTSNVRSNFRELAIFYSSRDAEFPGTTA